MFKKIQHIHFIGIGGSGMSGIAEVLLTLGYKVTGSDAKESDVTRRLTELGATVFIGHKTGQVGGAHVVVTSTAIAATNPEFIESMMKKVPVIPRIEMLAELGRLKYTVAVAGTHGKTTTTSLVSLVLTAGGLDPTVVVGGRMHNIGTGARVGRGEYLVAEADESDGSFLKLAPTLAIVTNIDNDHLDFWKRMPALYHAFQRYVNSVPFYGSVILGIDDLGSRKLMPRVQRPLITYGLAPEAEVRAVDLRAEPGRVTFSVTRKGERLGEVSWSVPGRHNVINSLAAVTVGLELGVPFRVIVDALVSFRGVGRRMEVKGESGGVLVVDDYGHHPTEVAATLSAVKERWPDRRLLVLFQPHRYTRTKLLADQFAPCFQGADRLLLMDIYAASEKPLRGVTSDWLAKKITDKKVAVTRVPSEAGDLVPFLKKTVRPGDLLLTLGAGDIWKAGEGLLKALAESAPAGTRGPA